MILVNQRTEGVGKILPLQIGRLDEIGKPYVKSLLDSWSYLPLTPYGSNWGHKIADFVFLPYTSFIIAFSTKECIKRYWETLCEESRYRTFFFHVNA